MTSLLTADLVALPAQQRLALIETLWDSLHAEDLEQALPDWKLRALEFSRVQFEAAPQSAQSWQQVQINARQRTATR
jgi:putative addiction module component (TIGR02574 family)